MDAAMTNPEWNCSNAGKQQIELNSTVVGYPGGGFDSDVDSKHADSAKFTRLVFGLRVSRYTTMYYYGYVYPSLMLFTLSYLALFVEKTNAGAPPRSFSAASA